MVDKKEGEDFEFPSLHDDKPAETPAPKKEEAKPAEEKPVPSDDGPTDEELIAQAPAPSKLKPSSNFFSKHKSIVLFAGFALLAAILWGVSILRGDKEEEGTETNVAAGVDEIPVNVIEARLGRFQDVINAVGTLKGESEIELRFEVDGKIDVFNVREGDRISKGQIIARLSDKEGRLKVSRAKIELEQMEKLFKLGGVSKTKLEEARLNLEVAQNDLEKTRLRATRGGIIGDKAADVGEFVTPQRKVATLVSIQNVAVKVGIIEKQVDKVYPGQKILCTVDAYPGNVFEGAIESISPIITGLSKTFEISAMIPNADSLLLPGMFVRGKIITYEADDAISVPNDALVKTPGGFQIFVVNKENIAESRDVDVGFVSAELSQIEAGLQPGEIVVIQKPPELKSGSKVKIIDVQK